MESRHHHRDARKARGGGGSFTRRPQTGSSSCSATKRPLSFFQQGGAPRGGPSPSSTQLMTSSTGCEINWKRPNTFAPACGAWPPTNQSRTRSFPHVATRRSASCGTQAEKRRYVIGAFLPVVPHGTGVRRKSRPRIRRQIWIPVTRFSLGNEYELKGYVGRAVSEAVPRRYFWSIRASEAERRNSDPCEGAPAPGILATLAEIRGPSTCARMTKKVNRARD